VGQGLRDRNTHCTSRTDREFHERWAFLESKGFNLSGAEKWEQSEPVPGPRADSKTSREIAEARVPRGNEARSEHVAAVVGFDAAIKRRSMKPRNCARTAGRGPAFAGVIRSRIRGSEAGRDTSSLCDQRT